MEEIHAADRQRGAVSPGKLASPAHRVDLAKFPVWPITQTYFHLQTANHTLGVARFQFAPSFQLMEAIEDLHPLPRRLKHLRIRITVK